MTIDDQATLDSVLADGRPVILPFMHVGNGETIAFGIVLERPGAVFGPIPGPAVGVRAHIAAMQRERTGAIVMTIDRAAFGAAPCIIWSSPAGILFVAVDEAAARSSRNALLFGRVLDTRGNLGKIVRIGGPHGAIVSSDRQRAPSPGARSGHTSFCRP